MSGDNAEGGRAGYSEFGEDDDDWNLETSGNPGVAMISRAVCVWAATNEVALQRPMTVNDAALAFSLPVHMIRAAVNWAGWYYVEDDKIMSEGL